MKVLRSAFLFFSLFFMLYTQAVTEIASFEPIEEDIRVPKSIEPFVQRPAPKPIKIPELKEKAGDLYQQFGTPRSTTRDEAFIGLIKSLQTNEALYFSLMDIPIIGDIPLPKRIKKFFSGLKISFPRVSVNAQGGFSISGSIKIGNRSTNARVAVDKDSTGKKLYSVTVELPKGWKFSNTFPKREGFNPEVLDLIEFKRVWLVLSSSRYYDPFLKRDVREGLNFFGEAKTSGPLFGLLNKLCKGELSSVVVDVHGVIGLNPKLIGTLLQIDLPVGIKFTNWLETTPLTLLLAIEEQITQIAQLSIGVRGGLRMFIPPNKQPILLTLTGKYSFPEDIELYGEMKGWLNNVPIPHMRIGDVRIGIITDLGLVAETEGLFGWVSGLNLAGGIGFLNSQLHLAVKGALDSKTAIGDMTFIFQGELHLRDLVGFWFQYAYDIAHVFKRDAMLLKKILNKVPNFGLEDVNIAFVPRETIEEKKRIELTFGKVKLFGLQGSGSLYLRRGGISGKLYLPELVIGPRKKPFFYVTGAGANGRKGMVANVALTLQEQSIFADVEWGGSVFGGVRRRGRIDMSAKGLEILESFEWGDLIDAEMMIRADLLRESPNLKNFFARIRLKKKGQKQLANLLAKTAHELLQDLQKKLDDIKRKHLEGLEERLAGREERLMADILKLEQKVEDKKRACKEKFTGFKAGLRPLCYAVKGVSIDTIKLLRKRFQHDVGLDVRMVGGAISIKVVSGVEKAATRPVGRLIKFLAKFIDNSIHIKKFEVEASLERLRHGKPFIIKEFEATMLGKKITIKNAEFNLKNLKGFLIKLFDRLGLRFKE